MKRLVLLIVVFVLSSKAIAQSSAGDPRAVDFSGKMDTIQTSGDNYSLFDNCNVGDIDGDGYDDIALGILGDIAHSVIRFGGPKLFSSASNPPLAFQVINKGDFNGDGLIDILGAYSYTHEILLNKSAYPYFDSSLGDRLSFRSYIPAMRILGIADFNKDGRDDIVAFLGNILGTHKQNYYVQYRGSDHFDSLVFPEDSLPYSFLNFWSMGKFASTLPYMSILSKTDTSNGKHDSMIGAFVIREPFRDSREIWFSHTDSNGVNPKRVDVFDITGDGISDLLVSDGDSIYIYKGDENFGNYLLTKANAYYIIPSPKFLDPDTYDYVQGFGGLMYSCGDLTGTGVPYMMATGTVDEAGYSKSYAFFYAGGTSLDQKYDAIIQYEGSATFRMDTLHRVDNSGRTSVVLSDWFDGNFGNGDLDLLMHRETETIPQHINPEMEVKEATNYPSPLSITTSPSIAKDQTTVYFHSNSSASGHLQLFNVLGEKVYDKNVTINAGADRELLPLHSYSAGAYIIQFITPTHSASTSLILQK